jgi:hypothetical protein
MASVEPLDVADPSDPSWLVVRGTLREGDLISLLQGLQAAKCPDATIDLLEVDDLTVGGCWAIRTLADEMWAQRRNLSVVFRLDTPSADQLRFSGTMDHPHIAFLGSSSG